MPHTNVLTALVLSACLLSLYSCANRTGNARSNDSTQPAPNNTPAATTAAASPQENSDTDSALAQVKSLGSLIEKGDSGMLKNPGGGGNMDSMMKKMQSMMGGKTGSPGDAIGNALLNLQMGQMKDDNPLKSVTKGMMEAQKNGTAGPSKTYTATYTAEQPADYKVPISGNGNTTMLQYTGGTLANNKKDGLWKNLCVSTTGSNKWPVYAEGYAESSAINMKVHSTSLASINEPYSIILNDQYKKYSKQQRSDQGKSESDVQVQKIGTEKLFGYNCVHIKVSFTIKGLGQTAHEQTDEWYSTDLPGAPFLSAVVFENHSPEVVQQMIKAGCLGALVKSTTKSSGSSMNIQLSSITQKSMPDSTFSLPPDYQQDKNAALYGIQ